MAEPPNQFRTIKEQVFAECDALSVLEVRTLLIDGHWPPGYRGMVESWLAKKDAEQAEAQKLLENRAVAAAERSASASEKSAQSSQIATTIALRSARWTMWAALLSLFATLVTVLPAILERWLP